LKFILGATEFFADNVINMAQYTSVLHRMTKDLKIEFPNDKNLQLKIRLLLKNLKNALLNAITITRPGKGKKYLFTDASKEGLSAVLLEQVNDKFNILSAVLKKMSGTSDLTPELEAKVIDLGLEKFDKANLLKESFTLCIDAKCFESFKTKKILSGSTLRFFERISNFEIDIQWIDGSKNILADFLLRVYSATEKVNVKEIGF
jgi:hypothetical protein